MDKAESHAVPVDHDPNLSAATRTSSEESNIAADIKTNKAFHSTVTKPDIQSLATLQVSYSEKVRWYS